MEYVGSDPFSLSYWRINSTGLDLGAISSLNGVLEWLEHVFLPLFLREAHGVSWFVHMTAYLISCNLLKCSRFSLPMCSGEANWSTSRHSCMLPLRLCRYLHVLMKLLLTRRMYEHGFDCILVLWRCHYVRATAVRLS